MDVKDYEFIDIIDYIILNSDDDTKMKNAIYYIDIQSKQKGMSFYQIIYEMFRKRYFQRKKI
jgi:hypothetical protein